MFFPFKKLLWLFPWLGNIIYKKELRTIRNSRYFDEKYYYFLRPDVFNSQKDAALHYLLYGWEEKTNPSEYFNTAEYLNAYPDVNFNPLLHYEWFGKNENKNIGIKPFLIEISNKQNETITNLENKLITIQNAISSLEDKFIFDKQQYTAIQEEQENKLTTIQNTVSFVQENLNFARRQTAEIQLVVQEEQKLRQNNTNQFEELKKQVNNIENSLQPKLAEQQNNFETKLTDLKFRFENHISNILQETEKNKKSFENTIKVIEEIKSYFSQNIDSLHAKLTEQQNDFESKLMKTKMEHELNFLNYQKQEHEKIVAREENTLKLQRDLFEVEKQISIQNEQIVYTDSLKNELEKLQKNIFLQTDLKIKEKINTIPEIRIRNTKHINKEVIASKIENFNSKGITDKKRNRKLIITLTSYPERMYDIQYCLFSLLTQSCKPDMVILWLSEEEFPNKEKDIPSKVLKLQENGLTIKWCKDNLKSYNKLIYALKEFPEDIFIIADDDIFYPQDWTAKLYDAYIQNPNFIHCHRAHKIKLENNTIVPYSNWEKCIVNDYPSYKNFFTGVGGVLCSSKHFHADIIDDKKFKFLAPDGDDIWFWAMAVLNNTKINIVENAINNITYINPERELNLNGEKTLWSTNKLGNNDKQLHSIIVSYPNVLEKLLI